MNAQFPDAGTLRTVLTLANRAPSIHNTQPWRWRVSTASLDLYSEPDMQLRSTDPDGRDLIISCGAALHHCVVALAAMGWQAKVNRLPDPDDPRHLATIEVQPHIPDHADIALAAAIPRRRTDRRAYSSWPVAGGDIALMAARAARSGVMLRQVDALDRMKATVAQAVSDHATNHDYLDELTTWSGRYGSIAGVPARNAPPSDPTAPIPGRLFAGPGLAQPSGASPADDNAAILALGTQKDDRLARLRAGEATSVVLLTATAMGLACCPITEPLEIRETREAVRADVFGASGHPQMLLRVGWAAINADPLPSTPRRGLSHVVEWPSEVAR
jgi:nitroreductase